MQPLNVTGGLQGAPTLLYHLISYLLPSSTSFSYLVVEVLPVVLSHEAEQRQEGPAEGVEAGVAVVRVPSRLQAVEAVWALPVWAGRARQRKTDMYINIYIYIVRDTQKLRQLKVAT